MKAVQDQRDLSAFRPVSGGAVRVDNIVRQYGTHMAVDHVSLEIKSGEFLALLGPSGSGKTTLLMMIAGFDRPDGGAVMIDGTDVSVLPPHKRNIGMVFQKYALFPHMTIAANVAFPLRMRKVKTAERDRRAIEALGLVGLKGMERRLPGQLSGGQQQRVALARAIVYGPPVLLMDEPLGALDKKLRERMQIEIKHLQESLGATVIFVTHDQEEAMTMADRIAVMNDGKLEQIGTPLELYETPANPFVAGFIGEANFFEGTVVERHGNELSVRLRQGSVIRSTLGSSSSGAAIGSAVRVIIRPERIGFKQKAKGSSQGSSEGGLSATVTDVIYAGSTLIYILRSDEADHLTVRLPSQTDGMKPTRGDLVSLDWNPGSALTY